MKKDQGSDQDGQLSEDDTSVGFINPLLNANFREYDNAVVSYARDDGWRIKVEHFAGKNTIVTCGDDVIEVTQEIQGKGYFEHDDADGNHYWVKVRRIC